MMSALVRDPTVLRFGLIVAAGLFFCCPALGDDEFTQDERVPRDSYELHYLGCMVNRKPDSKVRIGIFRFIWKANDPTKFFGIVFSDGKSKEPTPDFAVHLVSGWQYIGRTGLESPGSQWISVQPGEVVTFNVDISSAEKGLPWFHSVKGADKARLLIDTKAGQISSDDIILPLLSSSKK